MLLRTTFISNNPESSDQLLKRNGEVKLDGNFHVRIRFARALKQLVFSSRNIDTFIIVEPGHRAVTNA